MLLARRNNSVSNWLNSWFNDNFFDTELMPHMNATAPAVNVKEDATAYKMEQKNEKKDENKKEHYLRREFSYSKFEQTLILPDRRQGVEEPTAFRCVLQQVHRSVCHPQLF